VALACDRTLARPDATFRLHELTSTVASGNAAELEARGAAVRKMRERFLAIYRERTGLPKTRLSAMMAEEIRLGASEAQELGFVHLVLGYPANHGVLLRLVYGCHYSGLT